MKTTQTPAKLYDLSYAQEMIMYMLRFSLHRQVIQIPACITVEKPFDFELMKKAINIEIERNDCMRLRFIRKGTKHCQYFLDEFHMDNIPVVFFATAAEQEKYFSADAQKPVRYMSSETFRIVLFRDCNSKQGIYINVSHICMDAAAVFIFFNDLLAVYDAISNGTQLPKPMGSYELALQNELKIKADNDLLSSEQQAYTSHFLELGDAVYLDAHGSERLDKLRQRHRNPSITAPPCYNPLINKADSASYEASKSDSDIVFSFCRSFGVSPEVLMQTAMHIHLSSINHCCDDHCFFTLCTRRTNRNTKRCGGTMTSALTWRTKLPGELSFGEALEAMTELQGWMFRHTEYPFVSCRRLLHRIFPGSILAHPAPTMFSWFALDDSSMNGWEYNFRTYSLGRYCMPLYTMAMRNAKTGCLKMSFIYRPHYVSKSDIKALFERTVKAVVIGAENPGLTLNEIIKKL